MSEKIDTSTEAIKALADTHDRAAKSAMDNLHCGSETWEYREARRIADERRLNADVLRALAAERDALREALAEAKEVLELAAAPAFPDPDYQDEIRSLGDRIGYGALMSGASAEWMTSPHGDRGAFVAGPCIGQVKNALAKVRAALNPQTEGGGGDHQPAHLHGSLAQR